MQYRFKTDEDAAVWTVDPEGADRLTVTTGTQTHHVRHGAVSPHHLHLAVDGRGVNAFVWRGDGEKTVVIRGVPYPVQDADFAERKTKKKADRENLPQVITPPMPSVVVRIPVSEGDRVCKGQAVIVLTAMKMETTLTAPFPGRVTKINVAAGEKVMPGRILVDIEKEAETDAPEEGRQAATGAPPYPARRQQDGRTALALPGRGRHRQGHDQSRGAAQRHHAGGDPAVSRVPGRGGAG